MGSGPARQIPTRLLGALLRRREDVAFLRGEATCVGDNVQSPLLYCASGETVGRMRRVRCARSLVCRAGGAMGPFTARLGPARPDPTMTS